MSDIIHSTTDIIRENNFQDVITLVKGRLEDVEDLQVNYYSINELKNKSLESSGSHRGVIREFYIIKTITFEFLGQKI